MNKKSSAIRLLPVPNPQPAAPASQEHDLPRLHLLERFNKPSLQARALTLVHAPMGYGKTTLLQQFLQTRRAERPCYWLTLGEADNDINHFAQRLERVLAPAPQHDPHHSAFERLGNLLLGTRISVFLDEFEVISNESVLSLVRELLKRLDGSELIIGSRSIPGIGVPRLRATGAILEITAHQLSFSPEEIQRLLQQHNVPRLNDQQMHVLHRHSGGWAAFLGLFCGTLDGAVSDDALSQCLGAGRASMESLVSQRVLANLPAPVRAFLNESSVLGQFDAALCDHALGRDDSREQIAYLERHQLFISRVEVASPTLRYHHLFGEILSAQVSSERRRELQHRAAQWYVLHGRPIPAVNHFLLAGCHAPAMRLIEQLSPELLTRGRARLLLRWLEQLPADSISAHPALTLTLCWALGLSRRQREVERRLDAQGAQPSHECQVVRAVSLAMVDRTHDSLQLLQPQADSEPVHPLGQQVMVHINVYGLIAANDFSGARRLLEQVQPSDSKATFTQAMAHGFNAVIDLIEGRLSTALSQLSSGVTTLPTLQPLYRHRSRSLNDVSLAIALYERNELERCQKLLTELMPLVAENGTPDQLIYSHLLMARIHVIRGEPGLANEYLDELDALGCVHDIPRLSSSAWLGRAWMAWKQDDVTGANYAYRRSAVPQAQVRSGVLVAYQHESDWPELTRLRLAVQARVTASTLDELDRTIAVAHQCGRARRCLELQLLRVRARLSHDQNEKKALELLDEPMRQVIDQQYIRLVLDEGVDFCQLALRWCESHRALLRNDMGHDPLLDSVITQLSRFVEGTSASQPSSVSLSPREIEVLALLETGVRNIEIAKRLFVSNTTVRTHLRNINTKLGARSRTEAVSLARQLKLL